MVITMVAQRTPFTPGVLRKGRTGRMGGASSVKTSNPPYVYGGPTERKTAICRGDDSCCAYLGSRYSYVALVRSLKRKGKAVTAALPGP